MSRYPESSGSALPADAGFDYDVAFSFLQEDEGAVREIADALEGRLKTFIYSDHQKELVAKEGIEAFSNVFGRQSRIVVVLYRPGWGDTKWTRIEETAIKNRGLDDGFGFVVMVPMTGNATPRWFPRTYIWYGLAQYGARGAAAVIEARFGEAGGNVHVESAAEHAARVARQKQADATRIAYLNSTDGATGASRAGEAFLDAIDQIVPNVQNAGISLSRDRTSSNWLVLYSSGYTLEASYDVPFLNVGSDARARFVLHEGRVGPARYLQTKRPRQLSEETFAFSIGNGPDEPLWRRQANSRAFTPASLAEYTMKRLIERIESAPIA